MEELEKKKMSWVFVPLEDLTPAVLRCLSKWARLALSDGTTQLLKLARTTPS